MNIWFSAKLTFARPRLRLLSAGLAAVLVAACGGTDAPRYQSVATTGELIDYQVDTLNLTYSYTITESQFGLTGTTREGRLTENADGSYTPSGAPDGRVVVLSNGLLFGAVRERFGADLVTAAVVGLKDPVTTTAALAADYNYVHSGCLLTVCSVSHGTLRIAAAGTWTACRDGNLAAGACTGTATNGTLESRGRGQWRLKSQDGADIGTAMGYNAAGQNVLVVDLKDQRIGGFGGGMLIGGQQLAIPATRADSSWIAATGSGHWLEFAAIGDNIVISKIDSQPTNFSVALSPNYPWSGMVTTAWGEVGFMADAGIYMLMTPAGDVELGVKLR